MNTQLLFERRYPHPPARVWRALTDPDALATWLMPNDFAPIVGHRFCFRAPPQAGFDGIVRCEVLAIEPLQRLSYSWQGGPLRSPTVVTWTLEAIADGTQLRLEHAGFSGLGGQFVRLVLGAGWRNLLRRELPNALDTLIDPMTPKETTQ